MRWGDCVCALIVSASSESKEAQVEEFRLIVAGSRGIGDYKLVADAIRYVDARFPVTEIVSGGARGVDALGEMFARRTGTALRRFPADWETHGRSAGYQRNVEMARHADGLLAVWDGESRGTKHMIDIAVERGLVVYVVRPGGPGRSRTIRQILPDGAVVGETDTLSKEDKVDTSPIEPLSDAWYEEWHRREPLEYHVVHSNWCDEHEEMMQDFEAFVIDQGGTPFLVGSETISFPCRHGLGFFECWWCKHPGEVDPTVMPWQRTAYRANRDADPQRDPDRAPRDSIQVEEVSIESYDFFELVRSDNAHDMETPLEDAVDLAASTPASQGDWPHYGEALPAGWSIDYMPDGYKPKRGPTLGRGARSVSSVTSYVIAEALEHLSIVGDPDAEVDPADCDGHEHATDDNGVTWCIQSELDALDEHVAGDRLPVYTTQARSKREIERRRLLSSWAVARMPHPEDRRADRGRS